MGHPIGEALGDEARDRNIFHTVSRAEDETALVGLAVPALRCVLDFVWHGLVFLLFVSDLAIGRFWWRDRESNPMRLHLSPGSPGVFGG